ncbi:hypothetical protein Hanom_Chr05g00476341 [Helianthus anomalus]
MPSSDLHLLPSSCLYVIIPYFSFQKHYFHNPYSSLWCLLITYAIIIKKLHRLNKYSCKNHN